MFCNSRWHFTFIIAISLFSLLHSNNVMATHAAGADLTYKSLGGLVYQIEATFYRDCGGSSEPGNVTITYKSASCSYTRSAIANKVLLNNGNEITFPCASQPSTCNGGMSTGIRKWVYRTIVTLPYACADWVFSYRVCCRNCSITTIQTPCAVNSEIYVESYLNNLYAPGNNSPVFNNMPVSFICLGQNFSYNQGVSDMDGDSLSYELITPKISAIAEVTWIAPATTQSPLASSTPFTLNPVTGDINFTPSAMQIAVLAIRVNEFRNGVFIGSTIRDMQVYTQNCYNSIPTATGINGTASYTAEVCAGSELCFTISAQDADSTQILSYTTYNPIQGSVITQTTGNRPVLEFCWTPGVNDINSIPYIFTVAVNDDACPQNGMQTFSYAVLVNGPVATISYEDPHCGLNDGSASANVSNIPGCTYEWNTIPVQYSQTASGLAAGNYTVTITDPNACSSILNTTLTAPLNTVAVSCSSSGIISCQSGNIGEANAVVSGGISPFTYLWSNGSATASINGLGAGTYTVTVTDFSGCTGTDTVVIASAAGSLAASIQIIDEISCYGNNDAAISVTPNGGVMPYSYSWNTGSSSSNISGLSPGNYTVTVTDGGGCTSVASIGVQPASIVSGNFVSTNISCYNGNDGSLNVFPAGGTSPYTYSWSNGASSQNISSLQAGIYSVTIADANGCTSIFSSAVLQPASPLTISNQVTNVKCFGGNNGSIEINVTGGNSPYSYNWNHGSSLSLAENLEAGNYEVTVTDANGCTILYSTTVSQPAAPLIVMPTVISNVTCYSGENGALNLTVNGGEIPYSFIWSNGYSGQSLNNIPAGNYSVTVTDANGCTAFANATVSQPAMELTNSTGVQNILCYNGTTGSVTIQSSGGTLPYNYLWNTGVSGTQLSALSAGTYTVTVTDAFNCTAVSTVYIDQPQAPLIPVVIASQPDQCSESFGEISLIVSGGTSPYTYLWSNGTTLPNATNLLAGLYTVTITDANGCNAIISESIINPSPTLSAAISITNPVTCFGQATGKLQVIPSGGQQPFSFLWNNGSTNSEISDLPAGIYNVTVTDANGCTFNESIDLLQPSAAIQITGNVNGADCLNGGTGSISVNIFGGTGAYTYIWNTGETVKDITGLNTGFYTITITDNNGCTQTEEFEVNGEVNFNINVTGSLIVCTGQTVMLKADSVSGGVYQWYYDGEPLAGATGLEFVTPAAGLYSVEVTNSCGTFLSNDVEVEVKTIDNVSVSNTQIICPPETAQLLATGGSTYEWTPASFITFTTVPDPYVSPITTTTYSVNIANEWGCKTTLSTEVAVVCESLLVPTGFSPNSDGVNDGYVIDGIENYPGNKLWVYNRYGKLVYKAVNYKNSWDGSGNISGISMGQKVVSGTYYFILDLNDGSKPKSGYLIIRG